MYDIVGKCIWENMDGTYYNTGKDYLFVFEGAEGGTFWIEKLYRPVENLEHEEAEFCAQIPLEHIDEFNMFTYFVKNKITEWQESKEGKKRLQEIALEELAKKE